MGSNPGLTTGYRRTVPDEEDDDDGPLWIDTLAAAMLVAGISLAIVILVWTFV